MSRSQLELRRSIWDLHSRELEQFDFPAAMQATAQEILEATPVKMEFTITGQPHPLSEIAEENLLRITGEALTNVIKHGDASRVSLEIDYGPHHLTLKITDDGKGFNLESRPGTSEGHFGLSGMSERAKRINGQLTLHSTPGSGTSIEVTFPTCPESPTEAGTDSQAWI